AEERALAGVIGVALPRDDLAITRERALDDDHSGRPHRRIGHVLGARVGHAHRAAGDAREPRRFVGDGIRALAAEAAADLRRDDAHRWLVDLEALRQLGADAEGPLRAGPDCESVALPHR